jgi:3-dehydroquinate synthetase
MVDASIGGKTGIDTPHGKNLIGSYYPAKAIISDLDTLESLPETEWRNGLAEILKAALIADSSLWPLCDSEWRSRLVSIAELAIRVKISAIETDPLEKGRRRILNFGHTVAHALEAAAQYRIAHGEAVAIGLMAESYLSMRLGLLQKNFFQEITAKIEASGFALRMPPSYDRTRFFDAMAYDKKTAKGALRFTLIEQIGQAANFNGEYCSPVPVELVHEMTQWMESKIST